MKHKTFTNSKGFQSPHHMEGCYKDLGHHKKECVLGHKHTTVPRNWCYRIKKNTFQNCDKMCTPNLKIILWTLGRFGKLGTWKFIQLFKKNQQKMKIFMWWIYLDQNNTHHKIWKMKNIFQNWSYRWVFFFWNFIWRMKMI